MATSNNSISNMLERLHGSQTDTQVGAVILESAVKAVALSLTAKTGQNVLMIGYENRRVKPWYRKLATLLAVRQVVKVGFASYELWRRYNEGMALYREFSAKDT